MADSDQNSIRTEGDDIAHSESARSLERSTIESRSIRTAEILHRDAIALGAQFEMAARDQTIIEEEAGTLPSDLEWLGDTKLQCGSSRWLHDHR